MPHIYDHAYFEDGIRPFTEANLSIASSAVLYGLSVYTVFPIHQGGQGEWWAFRLDEHYERLVRSAHIIGLDTFVNQWPKSRFLAAMRELAEANQPKSDVFVRVTVHVNALLPGTRSRGLATILSAFMHEATPILPQDGARLKTSLWRRIPDFVIPSRAKVNGAYVNSVLGKQDALDSGYDDCIFLDSEGHVCELSAANIFIVREGSLITPGATNDLLEGINRRTVIELAQELKLKVVERPVDLTELYIADEIFACGTSAYLVPVLEVDHRQIGGGEAGPLTKNLGRRYHDALRGRSPKHQAWLTNFRPS
jgi:branched-chain amino acid aminotransferase